MKKPQPRPSTDAGDWQRLPNALALDGVPLEQLLQYKRTLNLPGDSPGELRATLASRQRNRDDLGQLLGALPPLCLVALEVLVEAGGMLTTSSLWHLVSERTGAAVAEVKGYARELLAYGLAVRVEVKHQYTAVECLALLDSSSKLLPEVVSGITLPHRPPPAPDGVSGVSELERRILALSTLTLHRRVRVNADYSPNCAGLKALVKDLGVELDTADSLLTNALASGLLSANSTPLRPCRKRFERWRLVA